MKPIDFEQRTDYQGSIPVLDTEKDIVSCWKPSLRERFRIFFGGNLFLIFSKAGITGHPTMALDTKLLIKQTDEEKEDGN